MDDVIYERPKPPLKVLLSKMNQPSDFYLVSDQHFYIQLDNKATFQHIDITITTIRSNKPYKFGKLLRIEEIRGHSNNT